MSIDLHELFDEANEAIARAHEATGDGRTDIGACVADWEDIGCETARSWIDEAGNRGYSVYVHGATTGSHPLGWFISEQLMACFGEPIDVDM